MEVGTGLHAVSCGQGCEWRAADRGLLLILALDLQMLGESLFEKSDGWEAQTWTKYSGDKCMVRTGMTSVSWA